jgi:signal transduction histidine kinase
VNPAGPHSATLANSRILVIDDITKNLQVVGTMLRNEGYHVMPATSGAQALERVRAQLPDLILLDLMMPEMDGLEVCRLLKAEPLTEAVPVIFLTASNEMEHLVKGFAVGAVDYVTKPFNAPELLARVRTHLELLHARQRLRDMNQEKNEFLGIAAHDLRSPLTAIQGFSEEILAEPGMDREELVDAARRIHGEARRMVEMVQNLLDVNAIERGEVKVQPAPFELAKLVRSVVEGYRPKAAAKQQTLSCDDQGPPVQALADPLLTRQIVDNLVSNAVKYSPRGREICVRLAQSTSTVRCEVQDQGPGLNQEDQQRLFGKFARLSAKPTAGEPSIGLGLSIVKRLAEAMDGRVWCESELGRGATFILTLPAASP